MTFFEDVIILLSQSRPTSATA